MTLTLTLTPEKETRLQQQAAQAGLPLADYLLWVAERAQTLPAAALLPTGEPPLSPTAALFAQWAAEDATDDPEEIARRQREGDALLTSLTQNPLSFRRAYTGAADDERPDT